MWVAGGHNRLPAWCPGRWGGLIDVYDRRPRREQPLEHSQGSLVHYPRLLLSIFRRGRQKSHPSKPRIYGLGGGCWPAET